MWRTKQFFLVQLGILNNVFFYVFLRSMIVQDKLTCNLSWTIMLRKLLWFYRSFLFTARYHQKKDQMLEEQRQVTYQCKYLFFIFIYFFFF